MEIHEGRRYHKAECTYCSTQASWFVFENDWDRNSWMLVCEYHKYTAFS